MKISADLLRKCYLATLSEQQAIVNGRHRELGAAGCSCRFDKRAI
jgi:hypothetical protein